MVCHFGTVEHDDRDLDRCPIPIRLSRVKTDMAYTAFIDRDTVSYLRDYLRWVELESGGRVSERFTGPPPTPASRRGSAPACWTSTPIRCATC